ncbi:MAG: YccF domain-containing protein [Anaerolineae bacterium]|nr:YccF domain-containing protein [Anaerolineae bacterium]RIK18856.1 MAG: YccF domain-containing protein [Anaerolineae bacterium]
MSVLGNIIWLIFGGLIAGLGYIIGGFLLCLTIIGIPFGLKAMRLGAATLTPFGKAVIPDERGDGCLPLVLNVIWILLFGWEIALAHLVSAALLTITIIGIPFAKQHIKLIPVAFAPFSYRLG